MRISCWLLGCKTGEAPWQGHYCRDCNAYLHSGDFRQAGCALIEAMRSVGSWWRRHRRYRHHTCEVCTKHMYLTEESCCSHECYDNWMPF